MDERQNRTEEATLGAELHEIRAAGVAVQKDLRVLVGAIRRERGELERRVRERPLVAAGAAFGVGFVLGGGLATRIGGWLLMSGLRLAFARAARDFTTGIFDQGMPEK